MDEFFWISGSLWLDAVNSEWISNNQRVDGWPGTASLQNWLQQASEHHTEAEALRDVQLSTGDDFLESAKQLRAALRSACESSHSNHPVPETALAIINNALASRGVISQLQQTSEGWHQRELLAEGTDGILWLLARSAANSWAAGELRRLKPCANPACILWFLDTSKNGTRRWCSMQACGNRHKVTAHYERQKER